MSLNTDTFVRPTGFRRLNLDMLAIRDRADQFTGVPRGTAKPLTYLAAFQEAEPYLGLPSHAFKLISWLVKQTMPVDWEEGSRPIAWPSARRQQEFFNLSAARVKALNRALYEAGIFVLRDNPPLRAVQRSVLSPKCNTIQRSEAQREVEDSADGKSLNLCEATESFGGRLEVVRTSSFAVRDNSRPASGRG